MSSIANEDFHAYTFGAFTLDTGRGALLKNGVEIKLRPQSFEILRILVTRRGILVAKDELQTAVWGHKVVTDDSLAQCLIDIRKALDDSDRKIIRTVPRRGYIFDAPVVERSSPKIDKAPVGGLRRRSRFALVSAVLVATALAGLWIFAGKDLFMISPARSNSIAVLSFLDLSEDQAQGYFADGISEELLNLLSKIPGLKVVGRTSSFAFKGKNEDLRIIGQVLGVRTVLEGSVRRSGDRVRITAQLIDVSDGTHIWSETYDRTMIDIFAVQDDVAAAIIDALQIHVSANPARGRPTDNMEAYTLFLKASVLFNNDQTEESEKHLLSAIGLDPKFAEAYELLARKHWASNDQQSTVETAAMALAINPDLVLAQALYQQAKIGSHLAGIEVFEQALRKQPGNPLLLQSLAWNLTQAGYFDEAVGLAEHWVDVDPLSSWAYQVLATSLYAAGRTSEATAALEIWVQLSNNDPSWYKGEQSLLAKRDEQAIAYFEAYLQKQDYSDTSWVRDLITAGRDPATDSEEFIRRVSEVLDAEPEFWDRAELNFRIWYLSLGFIDRYFKFILNDDPNDERWSNADFLLNDGVRNWRSGFTAHPKFLEVAESMGLIKIWEKRGPPDFCEKVGGQWVCE